ncbi:hypothetical protein LptCag_2505 [Leptospirillum ferriphilum]|uniref:Uncharacterized protein n=1 Tax=Leptospirillum ferriphilum TaxID=178606 RepID=A0A094YPC3_9BACT|nr:hypothetical protein LptCag_2505 [Leptospirillum ferriphilum]
MSLWSRVFCLTFRQEGCAGAYGPWAVVEGTRKNDGRFMKKGRP